MGWGLPSIVDHYGDRLGVFTSKVRSIDGNISPQLSLGGSFRSLHQVASSKEQQQSCDAQNNCESSNDYRAKGHPKFVVPLKEMDERPEPRASFILFGVFLMFGPALSLLLVARSRGWDAFRWGGVLFLLCWISSAFGLIGYAMWQ
jgi:hypothetical protein